jgi:urea transport system permease protein
MLGIVPSLELLIFVALGGRGTISGAVIGAVMVNYARTTLSERFPSGWLYLQGAIFIVVIAFAPGGLAGVARSARERFRRTPTVASHVSTQLSTSTLPEFIGSEVAS